MKIIRNEIEIELTEAEIEQIYRERERFYHGLDVKGEYENLYTKECPYSDEEAQIIGDRAMNIIDKIDGYWDYYWAAFDRAIEEKEGK